MNDDERHGCQVWLASALDRDYRKVHDKEKRWESFDEEKSATSRPRALLTDKTWPRKNVSRRKSGRYDETKHKKSTRTIEVMHEVLAHAKGCALANIYRVYRNIVPPIRFINRFNLESIFLFNEDSFGYRLFTRPFLLFSLNFNFN